MKKYFTLVMNVALLCALLPNPAAAAATTITAISGNLTVNADNSPATISGTVNAGTYSITVQSGCTLIVANGANLTVGGTVNVQSGGTVETTGTVIVENGGSVTLNGALTNNGLLNLNGGTITINTGATVSTPGMIEVGGTITNSGNVVPTGFFKVPNSSSPDSFYIDTYGNCDWTTWHNQFLTGDDPVQLRTGAGTLTVPSGQTLVLGAQSYLSIGGTLVVNGEVNVNSSYAGEWPDGVVDILGSGNTLTINNGATFTVTKGKFHAAGSSVINLAGTLTLNNPNTGSYSNYASDGHWKGHTLNGTLTLTGTGSLIVSGSGYNATISDNLNAGSVNIAAGASIEVSGGAELAVLPDATFYNNGTLTVTGTGSRLISAKAFTGSDGTILIDGGATLGGTAASISGITISGSPLSGFTTGANTIHYAVTGVTIGALASDALPLVTGSATKGTLTLTATLLPNLTDAPTGATHQPATVTWSSSDETVALVSETGIITALKNGSATITATAGEVTSDPVTINVSGSVINSIASNLTVDATNTPATISTSINAGSNNITIANGAKLTIANGATLTLSGTLTNNDTLTNNGTITGGIIVTATEASAGEVTNAAILLNDTAVIKGEYNWSAALQDRLTAGTLKQINLTGGATNQLVLAVGLFVPTTRSLIIHGGSNPGKIVANTNSAYVIPQAFQFHAAPPLLPQATVNGITAAGLIIWDVEQNKFVDATDVTATEGFFAYAKESSAGSGTFVIDSIHVVGEATWPETGAVVDAFNTEEGNITLVVENNASLDISNGLTVPDGAKLVVAGVLTASTSEETKANLTVNGTVELIGDATLPETVEVAGSAENIVVKEEETSTPKTALLPQTFEITLPGGTSSVSGDEVFIVTPKVAEGQTATPLTPGTDYTVDYANGIPTGTITGAGNYSGSLTYEGYKAVSGVTTVPTSINLYATATGYQTESVTVTVNAAAGEASNTNVYWGVLPEGVTITPNYGAAGTTYTVSATQDVAKTSITVYTVEGGKTAQLTVEAGNLPVTGIEITNKAGTVLEDVAIKTYDLAVGFTWELGYRYQPVADEGIVQDQPSVSWSSKHGYATVDEAGKVTGVANGTDTIYATVSDNIKDSVAIKVQTESVENVKVSPVFPTPLPAGAEYRNDSVWLNRRDTLQLTATITPATATDKTVSWKSLQPNIASVDQNGVVKGKADGVAKIAVFTYDGEKSDTIVITFFSKAVVKVTIDHKNYNEVNPLVIDSTRMLTATIEPEDATDKTIEWKSLNEGIAKVEKVSANSAKVTGISAGEAKIVVTSSNKQADTLTLTVYKVDVESVRITGVSGGVLEKDTLWLQLDAATQITWEVKPENASNRTVTWSSSNEEVATVDSGKVQTLSADTAQLTVTADGGKKATVTIVVYAVPVTSVTIGGPSAVSLQKGRTLQLQIEVLPEEANNKAVTWKSDKPSVATVDSGLVTGVSAGEAQIIVTSEESALADTVKVTVYEVFVDSVRITADKDSLNKSDSLQLTANIYPADANDQTVTWRSLTPEIVTVDQTGKVKALRDGIAQITAITYDGEHRDTIVFKVYSVAVSGIRISHKDYTEVVDTLPIGQTLELLATVTPDDATDKTVTWTSSNEAVATVTNGKVTGIADGEAIIYATAGDNIRDSVVIKVFYTEVAGVTIENKTAIAKDSLPIDSALQLIANVEPAYATYPSVTWRSSNEAVATVSENGTVTGIAAGEATITVTTVEGNKKDSVTIKVYAIRVESVKIAAAGSVTVGKTLQLTATVEPENATDKRITWSSGNEAVATVDATGLVTGVNVGEAFIYVTTVVGGWKDSVTITVYPVHVEGVTIAGADSLVPGQTLKLTATVTPENATDKSVTWSSGNESVATVANGTVTGVAPGETYIYVITVDGGLKDSVYIKVNPIAVEGVTIAAADNSVAAGQTLQLTATVTPENATNKTVTWSSSNESVATVSKDGVVTGVADGEATIYVTTEDGEYRDSIAISVYTIPVPVTGVTIAAAPDSVAKGATLQLTATVKPENATNKAVTWSSSNEEVATVSEDGVVTGVADGKATIYVTTEDGEYRDSIAISVYTIPVPVEGVTIAAATDSVAKDSTLQLTAVILPEGANVVYETAWASSADSIATVDSTGLVTGVADGEATIYVTVTTEDSIAYTDSVTIAVYTEEPGIVVPKITGVAILGSSDTLGIHTHENGTPTRYNTRQLTADITVEGEGEVEFTVAWSSSDSAKATVDTTGLVTAVSDGIATITLTVKEISTGEEFTDSVTITILTVGIAPVPASSVKAYIADNTLYVNSAVAEKVDIYTISGKLVYSAVKPAGEVQIPLTEHTDGVLIIRGASGWVQKAVK